MAIPASASAARKEGDEGRSGFHMPPSRHSCDELMSRSLHDACGGDDDDSDYVMVDDFCHSRVGIAFTALAYQDIPN